MRAERPGRLQLPFPIARAASFSVTGRDLPLPLRLDAGARDDNTSQRILWIGGTGQLPPKAIHGARVRLRSTSAVSPRSKAAI